MGCTASGGGLTERDVELLLNEAIQKLLNDNTLQAGLRDCTGIDLKQNSVPTCTQFTALEGEINEKFAKIAYLHLLNAHGEKVEAGDAVILVEELAGLICKGMEENAFCIDQTEDLILDDDGTTLRIVGRLNDFTVDLSGLGGSMQDATGVPETTEKSAIPTTRAGDADFFLGKPDKWLDAGDGYLVPAYKAR